MDCSLPGSSIREIFQARALEWGAIAFSALCFKHCLFFSFMGTYILPDLFTELKIHDQIKSKSNVSFLLF